VRTQGNGADLHRRSVRSSRAGCGTAGVGAGGVLTRDARTVPVLSRAHSNATEATRVHRYVDGDEQTAWWWPGCSPTGPAL